MIGSLFLAHSSGSDATYDMYNGTFDTTYLGLAYADGSSGTYNSHNGQVSAFQEAIGFLGTGSFIQTGGTHTVDYQLYVGDYAGSNGTYTISAGSLSVPEFYIGHDYTGSRGTLNITGSAASITVSARMDFAGDSIFTAVPGSTIHMTGSIFKNYNTDPSDLAGLSNLELIFEGGSGGVANFEVASEDMGAVIGGWTDNFALGTLTLGGIDVGKIQLRDTFNNQPGIEALYVSNLNIGAGSYLDLNGLNLYYLEGSIDPAATIVYNGGNLVELLPGDFDLDGDVDGVDFGLWQSGYPTASGASLGDVDGDGDVDGVDFGIWQANYPTNMGSAATMIPEPATLGLLILGGLALLRRRK